MSCLDRGVANVLKPAAPPEPLYSDDNRQDPYPYYKELRKTAPVHCVAGQNVWTVSRCEHVEEVLSQPNLYSSANLGTVDNSLQGADDPGHARVRKIAARALSNKQMAALEGRIRALASDSVDRIIQWEHCDFVADLATPFPLQVIAMVLDFEPDRWKDFNRWSQASIADNFRGLDGETKARFAADLKDRDTYLKAHLAKCRAGEGRGVVCNEVIPDLSDDEAIDVLCVLLVAGNETTKHLLSNIAVALVENPGLFETLRKDPKLIPAMVEETLRINSPVLSIARRTTKDVELGGQKVPSDSPMFILLGSANHSEARFPDADQFDLSRKQRHFSFGHGIHFCSGAALLRLEARILLETLVERQVTFESVRPIEEIKWDPHTHLRGPQHLEIRLRPVEREPAPSSAPHTPSPGCPHH
jgi:cytochrome P450